ncbi:MAG: hypothetical protein WC838_06820 [Candidatus Margulisiibacteriota bacterium]|jgi:hypothetical protein
MNTSCKIITFEEDLAYLPETMEYLAILDKTVQDNLLDVYEKHFLGISALPKHLQDRAVIEATVLTAQKYDKWFMHELIRVIPREFITESLVAILMSHCDETGLEDLLLQVLEKGPELLTSSLTRGAMMQCNDVFVSQLYTALPSELRDIALTEEALRRCIPLNLYELCLAIPRTIIPKLSSEIKVEVLLKCFKDYEKDLIEEIFEQKEIIE